MEFACQKKLAIDIILFCAAVTVVGQKIFKLVVNQPEIYSIMRIYE